MKGTLESYLKEIAQPFKTLSGLVCLTIALQVEAYTKTQSLRSILNHFSDTRNVYIDPVAKQRARDFIVNMFKDHGLHTWTEEFPSNQEKYPGVNIIGRLPGRYTGTRDDKMVLIGSHYDTVPTSSGVDDNGSGMTALLQALMFITSPGTVILLFLLLCL
ncbi:uncharacterized protein LOC110050916 [Orbicella faveolata]|uniref:uncharacterized protein LOC110050916 n=1 Tax=Orbicella faveolata TaxID=48498 RepID=UPI0009E1C32B|nr:uncharacterized protein LOC110050916 [Orbicella faveolata]